MRQKKSLVLLLICFVTSVQLFAQGGEIEDVEFIIEKDRKIEMPEIIRNFEKNNTALKPAPAPKQTYSYKQYTMDILPVEPKLRLVQLKQDPLEKLYPGYVRAGFGNYGSTMLDAFINSKRTKDYAYGASFRHFASANGPVENSGWSRNHLSGYGKYFLKKATLEGDFTYGRERYNFYGYDQERFKNREADSVRQVFNTVAFRTRLSNNKLDSITIYDARLNFFNLADRFNAGEFEVQGLLNGSRKLDKTSAIELQSEVSLSRYRDSSSISRNLIRVRPTYHFQVSGFEVEAGFNFVYTNDTVGSNAHFYPILKASYDFIPGKLNLYAGLGGDMEKQLLRSHLAMNPFLGPNQRIFHTNRYLDLYVGAKANPAANFTVDASLQFANYRWLPFYMNDGADSSRMMIVYASGGSRVVRFNLSGVYQASSDLQIGVRMQAQSFSLDTLKRPYHTPTFQLAGFARASLSEKVLVSGELQYYNGMYARTIQTKGETKLPGFANLNLKMEYLISDKFSAFVEVDNALNQKNPRFLYYPTRGILFLLGATASF